MRRHATNSSLTLYAVCGYVGYREGSSGDYTQLAQGAYKDFEQDTNANNKWMVKLGRSNSICELHRRVTETGAPPQDADAKKETLCLRVAVDDGRYTEVRVASRPRLRKAGHEAGGNIQQRQRRMHRKVEYKAPHTKIHYHVRVREPRNQQERFKITIVKESA